MSQDYLKAILKVKYYYRKIILRCSLLMDMSYDMLLHVAEKSNFLQPLKFLHLLATRTITLIMKCRHWAFHHYRCRRFYFTLQIIWIKSLILLSNDFITYLSYTNFEGRLASSLWCTPIVQDSNSIILGLCK